MSDRPQDQRQLSAKHRRVAAFAGAAALGMLAMAYAAVPLYQLFCQVTGYGGTTQRAAAPSDRVVDRYVTVRFDSNVARDLPWTFEPLQRTMEVKVGENQLAYYRATNISDRPVTGTASFNVAPDVAGQHFAKVQCFCFIEQTLAPGQSMDMPVSFFVDPSFAEDANAMNVSQITLSYTFFRTEAGENSGSDSASNTSTDRNDGRVPPT